MRIFQRLSIERPFGGFGLSLKNFRTYASMITKCAQPKLSKTK